MRITAQMCQNYSINNIARNYNNAIKLSNHIAAERQVLDLQDNPASAITGIRMTTLIAKTTQYSANAKTGISALDLADAKLGSIKSLLDEAAALVTGSATESTTADERQTNAVELNSLLQQILQLANGKDGERYLFGGSCSGDAPFSSIGKYTVYNGNDQTISIQTGGSSTTAINCTGTDAFGNMTAIVASRDLNPGVNLCTDISTPLSSLNGGSGVPSGKITIYYSAYPQGLEVELSGCATLEDVKDCIEQATLNASRDLDPVNCSWLDGGSLDWRDLQDRYVRVTMNPDGNGISLQEFDLGEPLPEPTAKEIRQGLDYSGATGYPAGGGGGGVGEGAVHDKNDYVYGNGSGTYANLRVDDVAGNKVATSLGIKGIANTYDPANPDAKLDGFIHGADLNPLITKTTLLADLEGYNDAVYTITNGDLPGTATFRETSDDSGNVFSNWNLSNLSKGYNTGADGELYARVTRRGAPDNDLFVEVYAVPLDRAKAGDLVATGICTQADGGTVVLGEANNSGVGGTVGILLPTTKDGATINLAVEWEDNFQATIHVPAFVEESNPDGTAKDYLDLLSGWQITGLDQPPADSYDLNHPASTDLDGKVSVNLRLADNGDGTTSAVLELYRPSYGGEPATLIATGELNLDGLPPLGTPASGRVAITGVEGFEGISGSVYLELPAGCEFTDGVLGADMSAPTALAYAIAADLSPNTEFVTGGAMELKGGQFLASAMTLAGDTTFKAGQTFSSDITLPDGRVLSAGTPLSSDTLLRKGTTIGAGTELPAGTVLPAGQTLTLSDGLAAGTVIPAGSYTTDGVTGFSADGMLSSDPAHAGEAMGFNLTATFATVEDLMRAVEEAGVYASADISADGTGIEFRSQLAGAHLTVSEDADCHEQMNDVYQQLSALDLNGLIKGVNCDSNGDLHTEIVYYPPDSGRTDGKAVLLSEDGTQTLIDAGYYVRLYSDSTALNKSYENRDNSSLVAEGFIPAGAWDGPDPDNPYVPVPPAATLGSASPLVLEERNDSGVSGTVDFDYYGDRNQAEPLANGEYNYSPYNNSKLTIAPGGLRTESSVHATLQEIDLADFTPGVYCDYSGVAHCTISWDQATATTTVCVYRDASRTHMSAKGELNAATGRIVLYETDKKGEYVLDANGNLSEIGSLTVADNTLPDGQSDVFTITAGGMNTSGQERESNLFSTINDVLDAMH
ncbi:MAG: hypothetical protein LBU23_12450, partial [Planctomycetota bacterium]|nr:hypothetical protein [Planctomycetota bacterium]